MGCLFFDTIDEIDIEQEIIRAGFVINKNVLPSEAIEAFLKKEWQAPHLATVPLDENAIRYFQDDKVPVAWDIGCPFSVEMLHIIRKVFVSKRWSADNINKLKMLEDSADNILKSHEHAKEGIIKAEKFSIWMKIYGTVMATILLSFPILMKSSGSDFGISYGFVIIAAILIFLRLFQIQK